ncbi:integrase [Silvimonas iriomotensis]|uniref:Transposase n=1 Tax=Silvimonas iriomotensis TaxID=449662 RepID=A0ABQ2PCN3_9NEIS|nr:integrase [Silvimonas iriomotensis]GGP23019.1 transposase [Silvimonas iriomotensis]
MSKSQARRLLLPRLQLTTASDLNPESILPDHTGALRYKRELLDVRSHNLTNNSFNHAPIVIGKSGEIWRPATIYLIERFGNAVNQTHQIDTCQSIASDLADFRRYLDDEEIDWDKFHKSKFYRPTYLYRNHIIQKIDLGEIAASTGKRKVRNVITFYTWAINNSLIQPEYPPWETVDVYIEYGNSNSVNSRLVKVVSTDVSLKIAKQDDPYTEEIKDGGRLRPLPENELNILLRILFDLGNPEMIIIHLGLIFCNARTQTILTLDKDKFLRPPRNDEREIRMTAGKGTSVDTKKDKQIVLYMPREIYLLFQIYINSPRAKEREKKADISVRNLVFLTNRGCPYYERKKDRALFKEGAKNAQAKKGETVRQYVKDRILPLMRKEFGKNYSYTLHDLRATGGMLLSNYCMELVKQGKMTFEMARNYVRVRMGHKLGSTTDLYLNYKENRELILSIQEEYDDFLHNLISPCSLFQ